MINTIAVGLALGLVLIGVIGIFISGIRNVINGNSDFKRVGIMAVPVVIFVVTYFAIGTFVQAGVATMLVMIGVMLLSIVVTGTRGTFNF